MVSQLYAIKLERLYKLNNLKPGTQPETGTKLQLRKALKTVTDKKETDSKEKVRGGNEEEDIKIDLNLE
jgi:hypothetical protein